VRVASKLGNLPSKFGHARPLGSGINRYIRDKLTDKQIDRRRTDGRTKAMLIAPFPAVGGIIIRRNAPHYSRKKLGSAYPLAATFCMIRYNLATPICMLNSNFLPRFASEIAGGGVAKMGQERERVGS